MPGSDSQEILELLAFPRSLMRDYLELDDCPHDGQFAVDDAHCRDCDNREECEWLFKNEAYLDLRRRNVTKLKRALAYGVDYVRGLATQYAHDQNRCRCPTCRWLRRAQNCLDRPAGAT